MANLGDVLQGKLDAYELDRVLADGRFGATYQGRRVSDEEDVVIKTVDLGRVASHQDMEIFERGSARLRQLDHPYIAPYLDAIVVEGEDQTILALVQKYVTTRNLREWSRGRGLVDLDQHMKWMEKALEALVYLHELRPPVVHGDLDAGNILIGDDGVIKIVDFATVRQELLSASRLATGMARGTLDYVPMEQLMGTIYPSSDLYALAMTTLAVLSGKEPPDFPMKGTRADIEELLPYGTDDSFASLLRQMTEPDPEHRLESARVALERLRALQRGQSESYSDGDFGDLDDDDKMEPAPRLEPNRRKRDAALANLMRSTRELAATIPEGEAWERLPDIERDRVHAFGIDRAGTFMALARGHDASVLRVDDLSSRGDLDFEELARRIAISRDGKRVAILTGFEDLLLFEINVSVWKRHHITVEGMWPGNSQLTFSPDGEQIAISDDDQVNLYRWEDGGLIRRHDVDGQFGLEYSPDGELIFAVGAQVTTIIAGDAPYQRLDITGVAFSPDGTLAAIARGDRVTLGHFRALTPQITWQHDDRTVQLPAPEGARLHMLRFSPNQRHLFVGCAAGFWRMIDVQATSVLPFQDSRADDRTKVKLFEVGFSADSQRLLMHANLTPDDLGTERMGCVLAWRMPRGEFLGSLLWIDHEMSVMTAQGFYGEVNELGSTGFSSDVWERPEIAGELFAGRDAEQTLTPVERAQLQEFHLRRHYLEQARLYSDHDYDLDEVVSTMAGLSHVALEVFRRADKRLERYEEFDYHGVSKGMTDHIEEAAFDVDADLSYDQLLNLNLQLVEEVDEGLTYEDDDDGDGERDHQHYRSLDNTPTVTSRRDERRDERESSALAGGIHDAPEEDEDEVADFAAILQAFVFAVALGFGVIFTVFWFLDHNTLSEAIFWGMLLGGGPLLTFFFYTALTRRLAGL